MQNNSNKLTIQAGVVAWTQPQSYKTKKAVSWSITYRISATSHKSSTQATITYDWSMACPWNIPLQLKDTLLKNASFFPWKLQKVRLKYSPAASVCHTGGTTTVHSTSGEREDLWLACKPPGCLVSQSGPPHSQHPVKKKANTIHWRCTYRYLATVCSGENEE